MLRPPGAPWRALAGALLGLALAGSAIAQVTLVERGHRLRLVMDSMAPLHPSQTQLETTQPIGDIESVCIDPRTGDAYVQLMFPAGAPNSMTTHVFRVATVGPPVVTPVALNTGFGICERGTDLQLDPRRGLLVTQDQNTVRPERIAGINPTTGLIGTWSMVTTPPVFLTGTFGMDFSNGAGNSVVPPGDIVFTTDLAATGIYSAAFGGAGCAVHVPPPAMPGPGDDVVNQPDGDWIWIGDGAPIVKFLPFPPHTQTPSALSVSTMFANAGLPFTAGTRAAVCDVTGDLYVSCSGANGGAGIFRVDEPLTTATLVLTIGGAAANQGLHDLEVGPGTLGPCNSVFFTVHDYTTGGEQLWEVSATACCPVPAGGVPIPDATGVNAPMSIASFPPGNLPQLGNAGYAVQLDDPGMACMITPGSPSFLLLSFAPFSAFLPRFGCPPLAPGEVLIAPPLVTVGGPVPWVGPGVGAVHPLPIPFLSSMCGLPVFLQGIWLDATSPAAPAILSWRLDLILGS